LRPTSGRYLLNGLDTATLRDRERAWIRSRQIGCVLQQPHLLPARSVLDNVMLAVMYSVQARRDKRIAAFEALDQVGLARAAHLLAGGLAAGGPAGGRGRRRGWGRAEPAALGRPAAGPGRRAAAPRDHPVGAASPGRRA